MKRLTSEKPVAEMGMVELAHNSCYAQNRMARYRDYELDIDARELARKLMVTYGVWSAEEDADLLNNDEVFDEVIGEYLSDSIDGLSGFIALFYRNLWAQANIWGRLKAYEDTGLTPEQIIEMDHLYAEKCKEVAMLKEGLRICPRCGRKFERLLALSRKDNKTMICDECGTMEALDSVPHGILTPQERTRIAVAATGNKWAMENFNATHN